MWYASKVGNDSIQTHPNCERRIVAMQRQLLANSSMTGKRIASPITVNQVRGRIDYELVESEWHFKNYGKALFHSLLLIEKNRDNDAYLHAMIGKCMYQLYRHQKNHTLSQVLVLPDPRFEENYDRYLTVVNRLRLTEVATLAYQYITTKKDRYDTDEDFLYTYWLCSQMEVSEENSDELKKEYLRKFPQGKYALELKK